MRFDMHTHHQRCGHAVGTIEDYIQAAIKAELNIIGISDHSPYFANLLDQPYPKIAMAKSQLSGYIEEVLHLKQKYHTQIQVLLGLETDYFEESWQIYQQALSEFPFDYLIGSVHYIKGESVFNESQWHSLTDAQKIAKKNNYYRLIQQSASCGLYQIIGHMDVMKGNYPAFEEIFTPEEIDRTLKIIADHHLAVEVNTSGKTKKHGGWYPSYEILERAHYFNVDITFGSDAHTPSRIGDELENVQKVLKEIGFTSWIYFKEKIQHRVDF